MAKTYEDVITEARVLLQDTDSSNYRYSTTDLLAMYNRALQALCRIRPDACYDLFTNNSLEVPELVESAPTSDQTLLSVTFGLEKQFFPPLVHYVVGMAEMIDDEYTEDGRAQLLLGQFKQSIVGL